MKNFDEAIKLLNSKKESITKEGADEAVKAEGGKEALALMLKTFMMLDGYKKAIEVLKNANVDDGDKFAVSFTKVEATESKDIPKLPTP